MCFIKHTYQRGRYVFIIKQKQKSTQKQKKKMCQMSFLSVFCTMDDVFCFLLGHDQTYPQLSCDYYCEWSLAV